MAKPTIIMSGDTDNMGIHNVSDYTTRLEKEKIYRDLSCVILCPTRGVIPARMVSAWQGLMRPMNGQVLGPIFLEEMEVGEAYNQGIKMILENPQLSNFKFILTLEEDNAPPPDGLLKLYEHIDDYDAIGGLYWTKGEGGQPMCYGNPAEQPLSFRPQIPLPDQLTPANGLGMGFTLFRTEMFKDERFEYGKWFKTLNEYDPQSGAKAYTQDLYFFEKARALGYKFACDARVKVGHWDQKEKIMW